MKPAKLRQLRQDTERSEKEIDSHVSPWKATSVTLIGTYEEAGRIGPAVIFTTTTCTQLPDQQDQQASLSSLSGASVDCTTISIRHGDLILPPDDHLL
jgi:hypothetical protein